MSIKKHIRLTGCSNISWKDAIVKAVEDVSKTIHNIEHVRILEQTAKIENNKITEYYAELEITFSIDDNIRNNKRKDV